MLCALQRRLFRLPYFLEVGVFTFERLNRVVERLQAFARGLAWLRENDPARHARLARETRHYARLRRTIGAGEGDVPPAYSAGTVLRYIAREAFMLGIALPLALVALVAMAAMFVKMKRVQPGSATRRSPVHGR